MILLKPKPKPKRTPAQPRPLMTEQESHRQDAQVKLLQSAVAAQERRIERQKGPQWLST